jgi:arylsulfatase A-like enzyme
MKSAAEPNIDIAPDESYNSGMKRKTVLIWITTLFLLAVIICYLIYSLRAAPGAQEIKNRYNVVMVVSDALRQDVLGCYGGSARTPNLDFLAENGVLFENAYSTSPWTGPSSVSMLTGNYATSYGHEEWVKTIQINIPQNEYLFIEFLKSNGYDTKMMIENMQASIHGNTQGFESLPEVKYFDQAVSSELNKILEDITGGRHGGSPAYKKSFIVLSHLLNIPVENNFFTLHWIQDPHCPYSPIDKYKSRIDVEPSNLSNPAQHYARCLQKDTSKLSPPETKYIKDLYVAEVESVDERIGFVLSVLKHKKLLDSTYIIFTSDHGELFGEHGQYGHGAWGQNCNYYEDLIRVPLIIAGPKLPKGKRVPVNVSLLDLMPTFKDLFKANYKNDMQGKSLKPVMFGKSKAGRVLYFDDVREHDQADALVENSYKLICFDDAQYKLFNVSNDPAEETDLAMSQNQLAESLYQKILRTRELIKARRQTNIEAFNASTDALDINKKKMLKHLKSLGYIE